MIKPDIRKQTGIQLGLLALSLSIILALRFLIIPGEWAEPVIVQTGYYFLAANFILFLICLVRVGRNSQWRRIRMHTGGILLCLLMTVLIHLSDIHRFKVLHDEYALLNNSMAMHHYQKAGLMGQALIDDGEISHPSFTADKRSLFFQFLLSLVHSLTGYRMGNVFILNFLLTGMFLGFLYAFTYQLTTNRLLSLLGITCLALVPQFAIIATSGGYDLLNLVAILGVALTGTEYFRKPDTRSQSLLVMVTLLLAQTRYESILYLLALALIVLVTWISEKSVNLSWVSVISPLFLFIPMMANAHMFSHDILQDGSVRGDDVAFMSMQHMLSNLHAAYDYYFSFGLYASNSVVLSILSVLGFFFLLYRLIKNRAFPDHNKPAILVFLCILPITLLCFCVMTMNFWGILTDPMASRFGMPLYLAGTLAGMLFLDSITNKQSLIRILVISCSVLLLIEGIPKMLNGHERPLMVRTEYHEWILDFANSIDNKAVMFSCDGTLGLVAAEKSAIPIEALNIAPDAIAVMMSSGQYSTIYAFDLSVQDPATGVWSPVIGSTGLNTELYAADVLEENLFQSAFRGRIYQLTGIYSH